MRKQRKLINRAEAIKDTTDEETPNASDADDVSETSDQQNENKNNDDDEDNYDDISSTDDTSHDGTSDNNTDNNDDNDNEIFKQAKQISEELFIQPAAPRTYSRHHGRRLLDPEEFYRDQVFLPFQRELKVNVENRLSIFSQPRIQLLTQLRPQHITSTNCSIMELYKNLIEKFSDRLPQSLQLFGELERWKNACVNLMNKPNYVNIWMNDLLDKCDLVLYPNVHFLLIFLATLPVTTSSAERAFSSLKRIKTYCRSTMIENRLNGLAAAFIHKNVDIDAMRILDLFVQKHPRHLNFS
ncbi:unnamed protein product [Rotaria sp. Silwood2]|nr:unnamed protein product [Rotaria sp. Silwood2]CAF3192911.1 unnamed protein product [Rotaria sp. Silwood2]CAF4061844.1 unnamed protein product [Rotaria sp. Silwood2]CAF4204224.1 unnamed protein product [Rotaria sp. Silwood2]CAF4463791.1 unnamed protein product [Rotaria sp. Silwood2]